MSGGIKTGSTKLGATVAADAHHTSTTCTHAHLFFLLVFNGSRSNTGLVFCRLHLTDLDHIVQFLFMTLHLHIGPNLLKVDGFPVTTGGDDLQTWTKTNKNKYRLFQCGDVTKESRVFLTSSNANINSNDLSATCSSVRFVITPATLGITVFDGIKTRR